MDMSLDLDLDPPRTVDVRLFDLLEWREAVALAQETGGAVYTWKTTCRANWLDKYMSNVDAVGLIVLPSSWPERIEMPDDAEEEEPYSHAKEIARKALNRQLKDRTGGALYFHHRKVTPNWSKEYIRTVEVGEHVFYKPAGGEAK